MDNVHDMGGMQAFGPINPEPETEEPVFHAEWESRVFAMTLLSGFLRQWTNDMARHARESQNPVTYLRNTYYENWLAGLETLWVGSGRVTHEELAKGISSGKSDIQAIDAEKALVSVKGAGGPVDPEAPVNAGLKVGDRVRVKTFHPMGHTRAPRYLRGREGVIDRIHGRHIYPDTHTVENVEDYPLYSVRFEGAELWGPDGNQRSAVYADLWEPYLERP